MTGLRLGIQPFHMATTEPVVRLASIAPKDLESALLTTLITSFLGNRLNLEFAGLLVLESRSILALNSDVLNAIAGSIEQTRDLVSFMKTCHTSHFIGIPHLLEGVVHLDSLTLSKLESFRQFMFADSDHTRFRLLHGLDIIFKFKKDPYDPYEQVLM